MYDIAAHLVDSVLPKVQLRQWVLAPPWPLAALLGAKPDVFAKFSKLFVRTVFRSMKKRAKKLGIPGTKCGAINFFQRHTSSLLLFPHNHLIALDGVYDVKDAEVPVFHPLPAPDNEDIAWVTNAFTHRMLSFLKDKGFVRGFDDGTDVARTPLERWYWAATHERAGFIVAHDDGASTPARGRGLDESRSRNPNAFSVEANTLCIGTRST